MREIQLSIHGMNCGHCVKAVERALDALPGIDSREVTVGAARVVFDDAKTSPEAVAAAIQDEGFQVAGS